LHSPESQCVTGNPNQRCLRKGRTFRLQGQLPWRLAPTRHPFLGAPGSMELRRSTTRKSSNCHRTAGTVAAPHPKGNAGSKKRTVPSAGQSKSGIAAVPIFSSSAENRTTAGQLLIDSRSEPEHIFGGECCFAHSCPCAQRTKLGQEQYADQVAEVASTVEHTRPSLWFDLT